MKDTPKIIEDAVEECRKTQRENFMRAYEMEQHIVWLTTTLTQIHTQAKEEERERLRQGFEPLHKLKKSWEEIEENGNPNEQVKTQIFGFNQAYKFANDLLQSLSNNKK